MATRSETLERLAVASPCSEEWEGMAGDERRRHCDRCRRDVLDFSWLTAREIQSHLEASGGRLCARVTWTGGRLTHLPPATPSVLSQRIPERRVSPLAATVVTAFLAAGLGPVRAGTEAKPPAPASAPEESQAESTRATREAASGAAGGTLRGAVTDLDGRALPGVTLYARNLLDGSQRVTVSGADGSYTLDVPAGLYDLLAELEGFRSAERHEVAVEPGEAKSLGLRLEESDEAVVTVLTGETALAVDPLEQQFDGSALVVAARAGGSKIVERNGRRVEVVTELRLEAVYKGEVAGGKVALAHAEYLEVGEDEGRAARRFAAGTLLFAFLRPSPDRGPAGGPPVFEAIGFGSGIHFVSEAERAAFAERLRSWNGSGAEGRAR
jgi:hypothetical protein